VRISSVRMSAAVLLTAVLSVVAGGGMRLGCGWWSGRLAAG
jgi:hypothetical protein